MDEPAVRGWVPLPVAAEAPVPRSWDVVPVVQREADGALPCVHGQHDGRESAPTSEAFEEMAAVFRLPLPAWAHERAQDAFLVLDWAGDVTELRVDGRTVTDRF